MRRKKETAVLLWNIRSEHNVGSIFRTADAAGVSLIYLGGITPHPIDRFGRKKKTIAKTALGAEEFVPWKPARSAVQLIRRLHKEGWSVVGVEQDKRAVDYRRYVPRTKTLYVLGSEVEGLPKNIRDACDTIVEIPMRGRKESLNVSVAAGVILFLSK